MNQLSKVLLATALFTAPQWAFAASDFEITVSSDNITGSCDTSTYTIEFSWLNTIDDGGGFDLVTMIATDEDARAIASDWTGADPGNRTSRLTGIGNGTGINTTVAGKSITVEVFDSILPWPDFGANYQSQYDDIAARTEPVAASLTFNPGNCDSPLYVSTITTAPVPTLSRTSTIAMFIFLLAATGWVMRRRLI